MNKQPSPKSRRQRGNLTHAGQALEWSAFCAAFAAFRAEHPATPGSGRGLADLGRAMGYGQSLSTLRNALTGRRRADSNGVIVPGPKKIAAAREWLRKALKTNV